MNVAILLSCDTFESFFEGVLNVNRDKYLASYRNDFAWYYAKGLLQNGVQPIIYIPSGRHDGRHETDAGVPVRFLRLPFWYDPLAQLWRGMRLTRWTRYAQEWLNAALFFGSLQAALREDNVGLLYVQEYWGGRFDHLAARLELPVAAADHGGVSKGVFKGFKQRAISRAAAIYCQTEQECNEVRQYGVEPLLQPNGIDAKFFHPPVTGSRQTKNVLTVARLNDSHKRTSDLIGAMCMLPEEWTLDIVGTGPDLGALEAQAKRLGVANRVTFHGFKNRHEVRTFCQHCGVYAMPSAHEAICLAVLEAMGCGAPVVLSRIRAFESIVTDGVDGRLYPVGDIAALTEAIQQAWLERDKLGTRAVATVSNRFNSTSLYRRLAESMQQAATLRSEVA